MQEINYSDVEQFYEQHILPSYSIEFSIITWNDHAKIGNDTFAHYFTANTKNYALVFEDFPSESHFIAEDNKFIPAPDGEKGLVQYPENDSSPYEYVENMTGYFSLYLMTP
jgi:hypothetical protein